MSYLTLHSLGSCGHKDVTPITRRSNISSSSIPNPAILGICIFFILGAKKYAAPRKPQQRQARHAIILVDSPTYLTVPQLPPSGAPGGGLTVGDADAAAGLVSGTANAVALKSIGGALVIEDTIWVSCPSTITEACGVTTISCSFTDKVMVHAIILVDSPTYLTVPQLPPSGAPGGGLTVGDADAAAGLVFVIVVIVVVVVVIFVVVVVAGLVSGTANAVALNKARGGALALEDTIWVSCPSTITEACGVTTISCSFTDKVMVSLYLISILIAVQ
eukprot:CAMPEP_0194095320 /NCGR_PEP_ID=MMETSP0149-20130528/56767_1 /TAXON_ID=122233 /ORGANISM="Chaetoceros debilis, Strain MM31A-1" /LENGTH=274 /DNA_ID=CAMNT_0038781261 /DNA_START=433 /DNA_END=1258 /DNA_ORIENTATION=+